MTLTSRLVFSGILLVILSIQSIHLYGQNLDTVIVDEGIYGRDIALEAKYLIDSSRNASAKSLSSNSFIQSIDQPYVYGFYHGGDLWVKFYVKNNTLHTEDYLLDVGGYNLIHAYYRPVNSDQFEEKLAGQFAPFPENEMAQDVFRLNKVKLTLEPSIAYEVILHYPKFGRDPIFSELSLYALDKWTNQRLSSRLPVVITLGIFIGISLFLALVNFIYYFLYHQKAYILYSLYTIAIVYFEASIHGAFDNTWLSGDPALYYGFESTSLALTIILYFLFLQSFINTKVRYIIWNKLVNIIVIAHVFVLVIFLWMMLGPGIALSALAFRNYALLITLGIGFIFQITLAFKGNKLDKIFLAGSAALFLSGIASILIEMFVSGNNYPDLIFQIGVVLELIVFSVGLRIMSKSVEIEKREAQQALIEQLKENEELQLSINQNLELQVNERTKEIQAQNKKLVLQQEQLSAHRDLLEEQKNVIEKNMEELRSIKGELEITVENRTQQLSKANHELIQRNNQLEQYGYITAHNLRGPVARLKGLVYIFQKIGGVSGENKEIIDKISNSALEMDEVINDINAILDFKNNNTSTAQKVKISAVIEKVKKILKDGIQESQAEIIAHLEVPHIIGNEPYLESIFYNLISNAIKYKSGGRHPKITISSKKQGKNTVLVVEDNGIGIDLEKHSEKIFGLYQRFHGHVGGKGLGLYLVKTQVEALGGTIQVESQVNHGARFIMEFSA